MHIYLSPDLKSGITFAIFIFSGNTPVMKDKLQIYVIGFAMQLITFFNQKHTDVIAIC